MTGNTEREMRIAAYLDGAMSDTECEQFEAEMEADASLAEDVARLSENDALLREAMSLDTDGALDPAFLERMGLADAKAGSPHHPAPPAPANDNPPFWNRWGVRAGAAIAAGLALVMTLTLPGGGAPVMGDALEATPSGQMAALDNGATLTPILTFEAGDGRFCREFEYRASNASSSSGIACRSSGGWVIEGWSDDAVEMPDSSEVALASGGASENLDAAYARLDAGDPLPIDREREIIVSGWSGK